MLILILLLSARYIDAWWTSKGLFYLRVEHVACNRNGCQNRAIPTHLVTIISCQCRLVCVLSEWSRRGYTTVVQLTGADGSDLDTCCVLLCQFAALKWFCSSARGRTWKTPTQLCRECAGGFFLVLQSVPLTCFCHHWCICFSTTDPYFSISREFVAVLNV